MNIKIAFGIFWFSQTYILSEVGETKSFEIETEIGMVSVLTLRLETRPFKAESQCVRWTNQKYHSHRLRLESKSLSFSLSFKIETASTKSQEKSERKC